MQVSMPLSEIVLISMALLSIAIVASGLFRKFSIPYTVLLVAIGILLSELAGVWPVLKPLHAFKLTPDLVFFIFLPALIFESGLSLNARQLLKDLMPVLTLAVPALLLSTSLIGFAVWLLLDIDLTVAFLFGALISATDPVAVVALFKELGAPLRLNVLIEGESLFNDATAIVVFGILLTMVMEGSSLNLVSSGSAIIEFFQVFFGGALVGVVIGLLISELLFRLHSNKSAILSMSFVAAYASFIIAEHKLHLSGVMATVTAAVSFSVFGLARVSKDVKPLLQETWEFVGLVANSLLFLLVGLSINTMDIFSHLGIILIVIVIVLLARAASVYSLVPATTRLFNLPRVSLAERHIMWWGGLKGGLAIAIVLSIPETLEGRDLLIILTLGVVLFTLLVNAWTIRPLMQYLQLDRFNEDERVELEQGLEHAQNSAAQLLQRYNDQGIVSPDLNKRISRIISTNFTRAKPETSPQQHWRKIYLAALRVQFQTLDTLYKTGLINQYTLIDIHHSLQLERENSGRNSSLLSLPGQEPVTVLQRMEMAVLKLLREKNWAAGMLSRFQYRRLSLHIQRDVAVIIMCNAVLEMLDGSTEFDADMTQTFRQHYQTLLERCQLRLKALRTDFSTIYQEVEAHMFTRSALIRAKINAEHDVEHGEIGVKAFNRISQIIDTLLSHESSSSVQRLNDSADSIRRLPLFAGLPEPVIRVLAEHLNQVAFMAGDIIIGEGDRGDALYIIQHGQAQVSKKGQSGEQVILGMLSEQDFFGEMALLGDHVRTATVTARTSMILLRLSRADIISIASRFEEVKQRLEQVRDERLEQDGFNHLHH